MWVNCWNRVGYTLGTPVLDSCLTIYDAGTITADYRTMTPLLHAIRMRGNGATHITLDDNVITNGNIVVNGSSKYKPCWIAGKVDGTNLST